MLSMPDELASMIQMTTDVTRATVRVLQEKET
jgi:hypothetical protein